jgi:multidrug efflux pump subunit AcrB
MTCLVDHLVPHHDGPARSPVDGEVPTVGLDDVVGAVDVGLSEQEPKDELKIELDRGLANSLGISVGDAAQALRVAFAGVEVGDWVDPTGESRDVAVRLHPDDRVNTDSIERLPIPVAGTGMMVAAALVLVLSDRTKVRAAALQGTLPLLAIIATAIALASA